MLTQEQIEKINELAPMDWDENSQGVFIQPSGIPVNVKEHVIYMRWNSSGASGGSCWDDEDSPGAEYYDCDEPEFKVLDLVLKEISPDVTYLKYKEIDSIIRTNNETENEYYGNYSCYEIKYIVLSELIELINK